MTDVLRFLFAGYIVLAHTGNLETIEDVRLWRLLSVLSDMSVSYFFICSGYFLAKRRGTTELEKRTEYLRKRILSYGKLYLIWTIVYLPLSLWGEFSLYGAGIKTGLADIACGILLRGANYNSWPLWYLLALTVSLMLVDIMEKEKISNYEIFIAASSLYLIGRFLDSIRTAAPGFALFYQVFGTRNGLFYGFFYVSFGMLAAKLRLHGKLRYLFGVFLGIFMGVHFYSRVVVAYLSSALAVSSLFLWSVSISVKQRPIYQWLRECSRIIYFIHMLLFSFYSLILVPTERAGGARAFLFTFFCSFFISALAVGWKHRKRSV